MLFRMLVLAVAVQSPTALALAEGRFEISDNGIGIWNPKPVPSEVAIWIGGSNKDKEAEAERGMLVLLANDKVKALHAGTFQGGAPRQRILIVDKDGKRAHIDTKTKVTIRFQKSDDKADVAEIRKRFTRPQIVKLRNILKSAMQSLKAKSEQLYATGNPFLSIEAGQLDWLWIHANYHYMLCESILVS